MARMNVQVTDNQNVNIQVTPVPRTEVTINRGLIGPPGPQGPSGASTIGGYPVSITGAQNYDALMFVSNEWVNIPQLEIADGGNF